MHDGENAGGEVVKCGHEELREVKRYSRDQKTGELTDPTGVWGRTINYITWKEEKVE